MRPLHILAFGDAVGKPGRKAIKKILPELKGQYTPDLTILQAENLAHGFGVTPKTLKEMQDSGIDFFTGGNHILKNQADLEESFADFPLIRPANFPQNSIGSGAKIVMANNMPVLIINLMGQAFFNQEVDNPFTTVDQVMADFADQNPVATIVDFHAETTAEKKSLGYYLDGRASLIFGTHTHVQTNDAEILPLGTGYITDLGMNGIKHSSLGMDLENIIHNFKYGTTEKKIIPDSGHCIINGIFAKINVETGKTEFIEPFIRTVDVN